jgi:hypothetical protein
MKIMGGSMKSAVIESVATPILGERVAHTPRRREQKATPRLRWGALYAILLTSVGLCVGGSRLVAAVGHSALIQYGVALAILGLLVAWVRSNRPALSSDLPGVQARLRQPFSVIHVAFSPEAVGSSHGAFTAPPDAANLRAAVRPAAKASQR